MNCFSRLLLQWYEQNRRDLPWRNQTDPYKIWISEIILQQTRVEQGKDYYLRFIQRFPDVLSLASAEEDEVLKYWQGLGYYSRARNLHCGARYVAEMYNGIFPDTREAILKIKGVGNYTASAIAAIAFNLPYAAIDGNVYRVLSRVFDVNIPIDSPKGKTYFAELAQQVLDVHHAGDFNQAMMDFGSLQCKPSHPDCENCCMADMCLANKNHTQHLLPIKQKSIQIKKRFFYYLCVCQGNDVYLQKRSADDIWAGLYEFPLIESETELSWEQITATPYFSHALHHCQFTLEHISPVHKHQLTHRLVIGRFFYIKLQQGAPQWPSKVKTIHKYLLPAYPVSRLMEKGIDNMP